MAALASGPQVLELINKSVAFTIHDTKCAACLCSAAHVALALTALSHARWVPSSARFVALGVYPRATGCLQVCVRLRAAPPACL